MEKRIQRRYSEAFKLEVVSEMESGALPSILAAEQKYGITGKTTIPNWLRKYGKEHLLPRMVRIQSVKEVDQIKGLKKEVKQLKEALADAHLDGVVNKAWLTVACREFGVTDVEAFKKKHENRL